MSAFLAVAAAFFSTAFKKAQGAAVRELEQEDLKQVQGIGMQQCTLSSCALWPCGLVAYGFMALYEHNITEIV